MLLRAVRGAATRRRSRSSRSTAARASPTSPPPCGTATPPRARSGIGLGAIAPAGRRARRSLRSRAGARSLVARFDPDGARPPPGCPAGRRRAGITRPIAGEEVCGDAYAVRPSTAALSADARATARATARWPRPPPQAAVRTFLDPRPGRGARREVAAAASTRRCAAPAAARSPSPSSTRTRGRVRFAGLGNIAGAVVRRRRSAAWSSHRRRRRATGPDDPDVRLPAARRARVVVLHSDGARPAVESPTLPRPARPAAAADRGRRCCATRASATTTPASSSAGRRRDRAAAAASCCGCRSPHERGRVHRPAARPGASPRPSGSSSQDQVRVATALSEVGRELRGAGARPSTVVSRWSRAPPALVIASWPRSRPGRSRRPVRRPPAGCWTAVEVGATAAAGTMDACTSCARRRRGGAGPRDAADRATAARPRRDARPLGRAAARRTRSCSTALEDLQRQQRGPAAGSTPSWRRPTGACMALLHASSPTSWRRPTAVWSRSTPSSTRSPTQLREASEARPGSGPTSATSCAPRSTRCIGLARLLLDAGVGPAHRRAAPPGRADPATRAAMLLALVNELLDLAKAESGRLEPQSSSSTWPRCSSSCAARCAPLVPPPDVDAGRRGAAGARRRWSPTRRCSSGSCATC